MIQIIAKVVITGISLGVFVAAMYFVWTSEIDIYRTLIKPISSLLPATTDSSSIEINDANVLAARWQPDEQTGGNIGLFFYDAIRFVNTTDKNITVKNVGLRYRFGDRTEEVESFYVLTGHTATPVGRTVDSIIIHVRGSGNMVLMRWRNLKEEIAEEKPLVPGAVFAASAAFILRFTEVEDFAKINDFQIVVTDYLGNTSVQTITTQAKWIDQARLNFFDNKIFEDDGKGRVSYPK